MSARSGLLEAIWIKRARRGPMEPVQRARLVVGVGLEGNANRAGRRQVTVIEREVWDELSEELGAPMDPAWRRANLMMSGVRLRQNAGRELWIGECRIELRGETKPCSRMDEAFEGLQEALRPAWRGGAYGVVQRGGWIQRGDAVELR